MKFGIVSKGAVARAALALAAFGASIGLAAGAAAAEIKVFAAGAFKPVLLQAVAPGFEKRTGHKVVVTSDTAGALAKRIAQGEEFDLAVLPPAQLETLAKDAAVADGSITPLAKVLIGVAVKQGAPRPDIGTTAAFKQALLAAKSVAYIDPASGGSSGVYLKQLFDKLGIAPQIAAKAVLVPGGLVAQRVVDGQAELGIHQISEIVAVPGAVLVGPLPAEVQNPTVYAGALSTSAADTNATLSLLIHLASEETQLLLKNHGMLAP
jgi:molybdate transport system substrate-binding protein